MEDAAADQQNIRVAIRCRPFNSKERANNETSCVSFERGADGPSVTVSDPANPSDKQTFGFDLIFDESSRQEDVFAAIGIPTITKAFDGYNGTIFAYGQTGSGKTWSMQGSSEMDDLRGIIPRLNTTLFERIAAESAARPSMQFLVTASYMEIYNEVLRDLLVASTQKTQGKGGLEIKESPLLGVYVKGLSEHVVDSAAKMQALIDQGMKSRTVASTQMNADSSRSHSVFVITLRQKDTTDDSKNVFAKINLVDLAGSERQKSTGASGATLKEGANINKSLSELGNVINALVAQSKGKKGVFVPYRNSKLTRVLQESLGGNSITAMLAALSPAGSYFDETLSTLKYANRAKAIKVNAVKNEEASQINKLHEEIAALKKRLEGAGTGGGGGGQGTADTSALEARHRQQLMELEEQVKSTWEARSKVSEEHERERRRLEDEQAAARRQLDAAREAHWRLLEDKADLAVTLGHVADTVHRAAADAAAAHHGPAAAAAATVVSRLDGWGAALREVARLEAALHEQDTVVHVYRADLLKTAHAAAQAPPIGGTASSSSSSSGAAATGTPMRGGYLLASPARGDDPSGAMMMAYDPATLSQWQQLAAKFGAIRGEAAKWGALQGALQGALTGLADGVRREVDAVAAADADATGSGATEVARGLRLLASQVVDRQAACAASLTRSRADVGNFDAVGGELLAVLGGYESLIARTVSEEAAWAAGSPPRRPDTAALLTKMRACSDNLRRMLAAAVSGTELFPEGGQPEQPLPGTAVRCSAGTLAAAAAGNGAGGGDSSSDGSGDARWWHCTAADVARNGDAPGPVAGGAEGSVYLELSVPRGSVATAVVIDTSPDAATADPATSPHRTARDVVLPCGVTLANAQGDVPLTAAALADVISWPALLKKTPPEKFLSRPPVRFLFDLFQFFGARLREAAGGVDVMPADVTGAAWDAVGATKESKVAFMDAALAWLTGAVGVAAPTTGAAMVAGADAPLTNTALQHLAVAMAWLKERGSAAGRPAPAARPPSARVAVVTSTDGAATWSAAAVHDLPSAGAVTVALHAASSSSGGVRTVRVYPLAPPAAAPTSVALRVSLRGLLDPKTTPDRAATTSGAGGSERTDGADRVTGVLDALHEISVVVMAAISFLAKAEDARRQRKQDEVRRHMLSLAQENVALEQKLSAEKQAAVSEKEALAERLAEALQELDHAHAQLGEMATLQAELLKLQAATERHRVLADALRAQAADGDAAARALQSEREAWAARERQWEGEREELACQVAVLTEERDAAQGNEEALFEQLGEVKQDLERLQESYVDMTDRCNDAQDEIADLREQVGAYKEALAHAVAAAGAAGAGGDVSSSSSSSSVGVSRAVSLSPQQQQQLDQAVERAGTGTGTDAAARVRAPIPMKLPPVSAPAASLPPIVQSASVPDGIGGAKKLTALATPARPKPPPQAAQPTPGEVYDEDFDEYDENEFEED